MTLTPHSTLLPDLLVDGSTIMFSRQSPDSPVALLWAWLTQLDASWPSLLSTQSVGLGCLRPLTLLHQLSKGLLSRCSRNSAKGCWVWLLLPRHRLPPPTKQGFAEPLLQEISLYQLSKDLLRVSYNDSADVAESGSLTIFTQQGDSVQGQYNHFKNNSNLHAVILSA